MEDKKVLRIHRVGVLCMVFNAYPNDLVCGNRDISGDAWLINWSTYVHSLCRFQTLTLMSSSKILFSAVGTGYFHEESPQCDQWLSLRRNSAAQLIKAERRMITHR